MVTETICELMEIGSRSGIDTVRCLNCGNFEDTIIRTNRGIPRVPRQPDPHTVGTSRQGAVQPRGGNKPYKRTVSSRSTSAVAPSPSYREGPSAETRTHEPARIELEHPRSPLRGSPPASDGLGLSVAEL